MADNEHSKSADAEHEAQLALEHQELDLILEAVWVLLDDLDLGQLTMAMIGERSGMTADRLSELFPNVRAMVMALADKIYEDERRNSALGLRVDDSPAAIIEQGFAVYLDSHRTNPIRARLRFVIRSDQELSRLDLLDGRVAALMISEYLLGVGVPGTKDEIVDRVLLVCELTDGAIRMIEDVSEEEAVRVIDGFSSMAVAHIFQTT